MVMLIVCNFIDLCDYATFVVVLSNTNAYGAVISGLRWLLGTIVLLMHKIDPSWHFYKKSVRGAKEES